MFLPSLYPKQNRELSFSDVYNGHRFYDLGKERDFGTFGAIKNSFVHSLATGLTSKIFKGMEMWNSPDNQTPLTKEEYDTHYKSTGIEYTDTLTHKQVVEHIRSKFYENYYEKLQEDRGGIISKGIIGGMAAFIADPATLLLCIATPQAPHIMEGLNWILGKIAGNAIKGTLDAVVGHGIQGLTFGAAYEMTSNALDSMILNKHTWKQTGANIAMMGALGVGFPLAGRAIAKAMRSPKVAQARSIISGIDSASKIKDLGKGNAEIGEILSKAEFADAPKDAPDFNTKLLREHNLEWIKEEPIHIDSLLLLEDEAIFKAMNKNNDYILKLIEALEEMKEHPEVKEMIKNKLLYQAVKGRELDGSLSESYTKLSAATKALEEARLADVSPLNSLTEAQARELKTGIGEKVTQDDINQLREALKIQEKAKPIKELLPKEELEKITGLVERFKELNKNNEKSLLESKNQFKGSNPYESLIKEHTEMKSQMIRIINAEAERMGQRFISPEVRNKLLFDLKNQYTTLHKDYIRMLKHEEGIYELQDEYIELKNEYNALKEQEKLINSYNSDHPKYIDGHLWLQHEEPIIEMKNVITEWIKKTYNEELRLLKKLGQYPPDKLNRYFDNIKTIQKTSIEDLMLMELPKKITAINSSEAIASEQFGFVGEYKSSYIQGIKEFIANKQYNSQLYEYWCYEKWTALEKKYECKDFYDKAIRRNGLTDQENIKLSEIMYNQSIKKEDLALLRNSQDPMDRLAAAAHEFERYKKDLLTSVGVNVGELEGRFAANTHDKTLINKAGRDEWVNFVRPRLNEKKLPTWVLEHFSKDIYEAEVMKFLNACFDTLRDPHLHNIEKFAAQNLKSTGKGFHKYEAERVIHFKDGKTWAEYNNKFGYANVMQTIIKDVDAIAYAVSYLRTWGKGNAHKTGSTVVIEGLIEKGQVELSERIRLETDPVVIKALETEKKNLNMKMFTNFIKQVDRDDFGFDNWMSVLGSASRALKAMASLGFVVLRSMPDVAVLPLHFMGYGQSYLTNLGDIMGILWKRSPLGKMHPEEKEFLLQIKDMCQLTTRQMINKFDLGDRTTVGMISKASLLYPIINGSHWWDNMMRSTAGYKLSMDLARISGKIVTDTLDKSIEYTLKAKELWKYKDLFSRCVEKRGDRKYFIFNKIMEIKETPSLIKKYGEGFKIDMATKIHNIFIESAAAGTLFPTILEKVILLQGTDKGTFYGEVARFLSQFKSYPTGMLVRTLRKFAEVGVPLAKRGAYSAGYKGLLKANKMGQLGEYMLVLFGLTYISDEIARFLNGKTPRRLDNISTIKDIAARSCIGGILGDMMFQLGEYGALEYAAGPVPSTFGAFAEKALARKKPAMASVELIKNMLPAGNVFYAKAALNYGLWNPLRNWVYDGWQKEHIKSVENYEKKYGGGVWFPKAI